MAEVQAASPSIWPAFHYTEDPSKGGIPLTLGGGRLSGLVYQLGLDRVSISYKSFATARKALTQAWGDPVEEGGDLIWVNPERGTHAVLMPFEQTAELWLQPYLPIAEVLADGGEFSWNGKHLLDSTVEELEPVLINALSSCLHSYARDGDLIVGQLGLRVQEGSVNAYEIDGLYYPDAIKVLEAKLQKVGTKGSETTFRNDTHTVEVLATSWKNTLNLRVARILK
ncbi:MAG: hypothetical protein JNL79_37385 [Myxococcales bacterium]|nr:hypothetical protein [Myxococcales bacterium]